MNLVKKSLLLCIGVLLVLLALLGAQSLYQVSRLSTAADDVATTRKRSGDARQLWARFLDTEKALQANIAFVDSASANDLRKAFAEQAAQLKSGLATLQRPS